MAKGIGMRKGFWAIAVAAAVQSYVSAQVKPEVAQILAYKPTQASVMSLMSVPNEAEAAKCTYEVANGKTGPVWTLKNSQGQLLRQFSDTNNDQKPDTYSYFRNGEEVYRDFDSTFKGKIDTCIWMNSGGMRTGKDTDGDGKVDRWSAISLEEVTQEVVNAFVTKDTRLMQLVMLSDEDMRTLGLSQAASNEVVKIRQEAMTKFQALGKKLTTLGEGSKWVQVITNAPSRVAAGEVSRDDLIAHNRLMIIIDTNGKTEQIGLGRVYQVGQTWKLVDLPMSVEEFNNPVRSPGGNDTTSMPMEEGPMQKLIAELSELDKAAPKPGQANAEEAMGKYHLGRVKVLQKIVEASPAADKLGWQKQVIDSLSAAASVGGSKNNDGMEQLQALVQGYYKGTPQAEITGYSYYRWITADYNLKMADAKDPKQVAAVQAKHVESLNAFVKNFPTAVDVPEAMLQAGMLCEYLDKEADAKKWYMAVLAQHPKSQQVAWATGSIRRLESVGKVFDLGVQSNNYNPAQLRGKVVVYYYWATWSGSTQNDFKTFQGVAGKSKVEFVCVNVDGNPTAAAALQGGFKEGIHVNSPGDLASPAAVHMGINVFPAHFLVGPDGKVVSRNVDTGNLEEEIKKVLSK